MADMRKFKLAHPLRVEDAVEVGLPERKYYVGEEITLPYASAMRLVNAGFVAGAEPGKRETVKAALKPVVQEGKPVPIGGEQAGTPAKPAGKSGKE